mmetsp:Transcript_6598/g.16073  ORF Transcript_6598/g.16073 Transcript_6598/m.16073 type:complete len:81 (-) Transcript_6598:144-386(-)
MKFFYALFALLVVSTNAAAPIDNAVEDSVANAVPNTEAGVKRALSTEEKVEVDEAKRVLRRYVRTGDGRCNMCDDDDDYF